MKKIQILAIFTAILLTMTACTNTGQSGTGNLFDAWFGDADDEGLAESVPGEDDEFPTVGSVPERPAEPQIKRDYESLQSGLVADNQNAQYSDQTIRSQSISQNETLVTASNASDGPVPVDPLIIAEDGVLVPVPPLEQEVPAPTQDTSPGIYTPDDAGATLTAPESIEPAPAPVPAPRATEIVAEQVVVNPTPATPNTVAQNPEPLEEAVVGIVANRAEEAANNGTHIATLYYLRGIAVLNVNDEAVLEQVADLYMEDDANGVAVIGHASVRVSPRAKNPALVNYKVSLDRAINVMNMLDELGIPAASILMDARGATDLARFGDTALDHAYNRRTEIYFLN